jgi:hypothetical protein
MSASLIVSPLPRNVTVALRYAPLAFRAFAGDQKVGRLEGLRNARDLGDGRGAGHELGAPGGTQPIGGASRGPGPRFLRVAAEKGGQPGQAPFEQVDVLARGTFLKPEDGRRPGRSEQR